jgi:UDP-N-acetylmuramoyl-L-alanyl-D-glutamate--2,6-diaminopimelate ligase
VPGRFEIVEAGVPFTIVVDYAHTPEGLEVALESARHLAKTQKVIVVFGAGGGRDREKRPAMGAAAAACSDLAIITSDNPRGEDPIAIIEAVLSGVDDRAKVIVEAERRRAIEVALERADPGDVVLLAGKGHESEIEMGDDRLTFDDRVEAQAAARRLLSGGTAGGGAR